MIAEGGSTEIWLFALCAQPASFEVADTGHFEWGQSPARLQRKVSIALGVCNRQVQSSRAYALRSALSHTNDGAKCAHKVRARPVGSS